METLKQNAAKALDGPVNAAHATVVKTVREWDQFLYSLPVEQATAILAQLTTSMELRRCTIEKVITEARYKQQQEMHAAQADAHAKAVAAAEEAAREAAKPKLVTQ